MVKRTPARPSVAPRAPDDGPTAEELFFDERKLARRWDVSCKLLQKWRSLGQGPRYRKLGSAVRYALSDIVAFEQGAIR